MTKHLLILYTFILASTLLSAQVAPNYVSSDWCLIDEDSVFFAPSHIAKNKIKKATEYIIDKEYSNREEINRELYFDSLGRVIECLNYGDQPGGGHTKLQIDSTGQVFEWYHISENGTKEKTCANIFKDSKLVRQVSYNIMFYDYSWEYIYGLSGEVIQQNYLQNNTVLAKSEFFYDAQNRMSAFREDGLLSEHNASYQYDSLGRKILIVEEYKIFVKHELTSQGVDTIKIDYTKSTDRCESRIVYLNGNYNGEFTTKTNAFSDITVVIEDWRKGNKHSPDLSGPIHFGDPYKKRLYTYDAGRRLKSLKIYHSPLLPNSITKYEHDRKGNLITKTHSEDGKRKRKYRYTYEFL